MGDGCDFQNADELIDKIGEYITYYNTKQIKAKLKGLTPVEYLHQALQTASLKVYNFMGHFNTHLPKTFLYISHIFLSYFTQYSLRNSI
ncbi:TPA: IS3 family transposase [Providencia alcalifaciens]